MVPWLYSVILVGWAVLYLIYLFFVHFFKDCILSFLLSNTEWNIYQTENYLKCEGFGHMCRQDKIPTKTRQNKNARKPRPPRTSLHSPIWLTWKVCAQAVSLHRRIRSLYIPWESITAEWTTVRSDSLWPPSNSVYTTSKTLFTVIPCAPCSQGRYFVSRE